MEVYPHQLILNILPQAGLWSTIAIKYGFVEQVQFLSQPAPSILWNEVITAAQFQRVKTLTLIIPHEIEKT